MADYIERPAAIESFENGEADVIEDWGDGCAFGFCLETIRDTLNALHAADVAPVVHGRWILEREPNGKPYCFHCSVCDSDYHCIGIVVASDYCPNCGAKMDGGADHGKEEI